MRMCGLHLAGMSAAYGPSLYLDIRVWMFLARVVATALFLLQASSHTRGEQVGVQCSEAPSLWGATDEAMGVASR